MKAVIVYYSLTEHTAYVADKIAQALGADTVRLQTQKAYPDKGMKKFLWGGKSAMMAEKPALEPYEFDGSQYDTVLFGTPVWASNIAPPLRTFIAEQGESLQGKRFGVFVCSAGGSAAKAVEKLRALLPEDFAAQLSLIDPKGKPDTDEKIAAFCAAVRGDAE